jgi:hypothetical protein
LSPFQAQINALVAYLNSTAIVLGQFQVGTSAAPSMRFEDDQDTGLFSAAPNQLGVSAGGQTSAIFGDGFIRFNHQMTGQGALRVTSFFTNIGGTADAITIDFPTGGALPIGMEFRFRPTANNTGPATININGLGAASVLTISGRALPASYLVSGSPTSVFWDGSNFIADRAPEYGSNANGRFWRYADGRQVCLADGVAQDANSASGSGEFVTATAAVWTFPAPFADTPSCSGSPNSASGRSVYIGGFGATTAQYRQRAAIASAVTLTSRLRAEGIWY